jgi:hypothetical protein
VARDFNAEKLKSIWPISYQLYHLCNKTLGHLYSTHRSAYKALPHPPYGKSDHNYILLIPAYKPKLKTGSTSDARPSIQKWSDEVHAKLHDCFASTDWNMFWDWSDNIEKFTTSVHRQRHPHSDHTYHGFH